MKSYLLCLALLTTMTLAAQTDRWGSEAAKSSSINAGYIVLGILVAFLAVNAINDGAAE